MANCHETMCGVRFVRPALLVIVACAAFAGAVTAAPASAGSAAESTASVSAVDGARKLVAGGDTPGAIAALAPYVAAHPNDLGAARYLGDLYYRRSDLAAAEKTYRAILRVAPDDRETHNRLGGIFAAEDRVNEAIAEFTHSLPIGSAYAHLVDLHRRLGDLAAFEAPFRRDAEQREDDPGAQFALGAIYRADRRSDLATPYLERAVALAPAACPALAELGSAYLDLDRVGDAVAVLGRCLHGDPDNYAALVNLGDADVALGRIGDARAAFEHALRARPDGAEALVDIGYLEDLDRKWQDAIAAYVRAIAIDPLLRDAYVDLGFDYHEHGLDALAEAAFLKGVSVSPGDGRLHYLLGVTYAAQGKRDLARAEYRRAMTGDESAVANAASVRLAALK